MPASRRYLRSDDRRPFASSDSPRFRVFITPFSESSHMAKSQSSGSGQRSRRPHQPHQQADLEPQNVQETSKPAATAVAESAPMPAETTSKPPGGGSEDVGAIDAET